MCRAAEALEGHLRKGLGGGLLGIGKEKHGNGANKEEAVVVVAAAAVGGDDNAVQ